MYINREVQYIQEKIDDDENKKFDRKNKNDDYFFTVLNRLFEEIDDRISTIRVLGRNIKNNNADEIDFPETLLDDLSAKLCNNF
jgi:hypothetical protein